MLTVHQKKRCVEHANLIAITAAMGWDFLSQGSCMEYSHLEFSLTTNLLPARFASDWLPRAYTFLLGFDVIAAVLWR